MKTSRVLIIVAVAACTFPQPALAQRPTSARGGVSRPTDARANHRSPSDARAGHDTAPNDGDAAGAESGPATRVGRRRPVGFLPFGWWPYVDFDAVDDVATSTAANESAPSPSTQVLPPAQPSLIQPVRTLPLPESAAASARGKLQMDVTPSSAQVIVDGFFVGTVEEVMRVSGGLELAAGWHRLELRAAGYVTPAVNVTIEANRTFSYHGELKPLNR